MATRVTLIVRTGPSSYRQAQAFIYQSFRVAPGLVQLTGYAAFGAFYFLAAALWLTFKKNRTARAVS